MAVAIVVLGGTSGATAQGRYVNQYSRADVDNIIRELEESGDAFSGDFNNELNRSNLSSSQKRTYRNQSTAFENATDRLRSNFNNENSWWESRSQVQNVVTNARPINTTMGSIAFRRNIERQWNRLRNGVNRLADTYDLPGIAGGGWTGGGGGGGGQTSRPPNWARGTFYSSYPSVTMTISDNGQVQSNIGGQIYYGRFYNGAIYANNEVATVSRSGNGIRTYNRTSGQSIDFSRGGGGDGGGGPVTNPPSWAVGTFTAQNGNIRMTITRNGQVTSVVNGQTFTGRYYAGSIYANGEVANVTQDNNGIRTYNRTSGVTLNFRRR